MVIKKNRALLGEPRGRKLLKQCFETFKGTIWEGAVRAPVETPKNQALIKQFYSAFEKLCKSQGIELQGEP